MHVALLGVGVEENLDALDDVGVVFNVEFDPGDLDEGRSTGL